MAYEHIPVLLNEVIRLLITDTSGVYVDCTLGGGGHAKAILQNISSDGKLIGIDRDDDALLAAQKNLGDYSPNTEFIKGNFSELKFLLPNQSYSGFLFDLGVSSHHIDTAERGFSFQTDGPLDMRMNRSMDLTAEYIVNSWEYEELWKIFKRYGEERYSKKIARTLIAERQKSPIKTTGQLAEVINGITPPHKRKKTLARIFQALRIAVNDELEILEQSIKDAVDLLEIGGRIIIISYHSLEDRIAKHTFRELVKGCTCPPNFPKCVCGKEPTLRLINKKIITPTKEEIDANPRARSAKLRCAERI